MIITYNIKSFITGSLQFVYCKILIFGPKEYTVGNIKISNIWFFWTSVILEIFQSNLHDLFCFRSHLDHNEGYSNVYLICTLADYGYLVNIYTV
jgi:hypothetical protein